MLPSVPRHALDLVAQVDVECLLKSRRHVGVEVHHSVQVLHLQCPQGAGGNCLKRTGPATAASLLSSVHLVC